MGDPKKPKKKFKTPSHPWQKIRLDEEKILVTEFGLKNKRELWKMGAKLRDYKRRAKKYISDNSERMVQEKEIMLKKLTELGILVEGGRLDDVLGLSLRDVLNRRLQTIVFKKGMSSSISQARQFITHRHIDVNSVRMTSPSYLVNKKEEETITFVQSSSLANEEHPERVVANKLKEKEEQKAGSAVVDSESEGKK